MSKELSVYKQLTIGTSECLSAVKREIGMKTGCIPFAVKLMEAMKSLKLETQQEELDAANTLLSGLQTLMQGGIVAEDYDKIDFVKRGKKIVPSARVEAFLRAAARKGYRITDSIVAVPQEDRDTTYFKENLLGNGDIVYTLEDRRVNPDRTITAERLAKQYFAKIICRLDIHDAHTNTRVFMTECEMSIEDLLEITKASDQGIFKSEWVYDPQRRKKERIIKNEMNTDTFWIKWTGEMVTKTVIRRALKRVKEVLPELTDSIYAFEHDEYTEPTVPQEKAPIVIDIPIKDNTENVNLRKLTDEQKAECQEVLDLWIANPKLAEDKLSEIKGMIESGEPVQEIVNKEYASIAALSKSKTKWAEIGGFFDEKG